MMSGSIQRETIIFFLSVLHGIGLTLLYDLLRAWRRAFRSSKAAAAAGDFLFCLTASFLTFCLIFDLTAGVLRGYIAVGIVLGMILYYQTVSRLVLKGCFRLFQTVRHLFFFLFRILRKIFRRIQKKIRGVSHVLSTPARKICKKMKKRIEIREKKGYNESKVYVAGERKGRRHGKEQKEKA